MTGVDTSELRAFAENIRYTNPDRALLLHAAADVLARITAYADELAASDQEVAADLRLMLDGVQGGTVYVGDGKPTLAYITTAYGSYVEQPGVQGDSPRCRGCDGSGYATTRDGRNLGACSTCAGEGDSRSLWCDEDNCPASICGGPHVEAEHPDLGPVVVRFDDPLVGDFRPTEEQFRATRLETLRETHLAARGDGALTAVQRQIVADWLRTRIEREASR